MQTASANMKRTFLSIVAASVMGAAVFLLCIIAGTTIGYSVFFSSATFAATFVIKITDNK